jgi:SpoVK/Ycf46/Vps4 family AAA+-type ATPase
LFDSVVFKVAFTAVTRDVSGVYERVLSTLLNEMDGVEAGAGVVVVGATTRVDALDAVRCLALVVGTIHCNYCNLVFV